MDIQQEISECYGDAFPYMHLYPPMNEFLAKPYFYCSDELEYEQCRTLPQILQKWLSFNRILIVRKFLIFIDLDNQIVDDGFVIWHSENRKFHQLNKLHILASAARKCVYAWTLRTDTASEYETVKWTDYFTDMDKFALLLELSVPTDNTQTFAGDYDWLLYPFLFNNNED